MANKFGAAYTLPPFVPVSTQNRLQAASTSFVTSYSCAQRQIKGWLSLIISVVVADYALITGAYSLVIFVGGKFNYFKERNSWQRYINMSDDQAEVPLVGTINSRYLSKTV